MLDGVESQIGSLSERELEVLRLLATGASNQQIARALVISPNTVKVHLRNIYDKLGVQSRTEATIQAVNRGWVVVSAAAVMVGGNPTAAPGVLGDAPAVVDLAAALLPADGPTSRPIPGWQRVYMLVVGLLIVGGLALPGWWQGRIDARRTTPFSDQGQPQMAAAPRPDVPRWTARAPLPVARSRLALAYLNGKLYAIGGETATTVVADVSIYDIASNGWLPGAAKPTPVANVTAALIGGLIYVPGGNTAAGPANAGASEGRTSLDGAGAVSRVLEVYDPKADTWSTQAPMPFPLAAYGVAVYGGRLYLFGGWDGTRYHNDTLIYDPASDRWSAGAPMPSARAFLAASTLQQTIYVVGGFDGGQELDTAQVYTPANDGTGASPWSTAPALTQPRAGLGLVAIGARLYAIGGGWDGSLAYNEQYDLSTSAWSRIESPVIGQWRNLGLATDGSQLFAVGGWSNGYLAGNEEYRAIYMILLPVGS